VKVTDVLDILGLLALIGFAFLVWPPAALLVLGIVLLLASFMRARGGRK